MTIKKIENKLDDKSLSRGEKRTRKTLENFSFDKINEINHVRFKKSKNVNFSISRPEVFQSKTNDSFLIFGEAKIES